MAEPVTITSLALAAVKPAAEKVVTTLLEQTNAKEWLLKTIGRDPLKQAVEGALAKAYTRFKDAYPTEVAELFDASFLETEGAPVLTRLLLREGEADGVTLAKVWADTLNVRSQERHIRIEEKEKPANAFLEYFNEAIKADPKLSTILNNQDIGRTANSTEALARHFGVADATDATRFEYLKWIVGRNMYLDPRGIRQTQRRVQVKLDKVYISLRAERDETFGEVDRPLLKQELAELEAKLNSSGFSAEEIEYQKQELISRFQKREGRTGNKPEAKIELSEAVGKNQFLVILGDPGCGKSTLLRYLAMKHGMALWNDQDETGDSLAQALFPILIRIADYAEYGLSKNIPLSQYLYEYCVMSECPKNGLADLLEKELEKGKCLILLDGLDEVVNTDQRREVVEQIENFMRRYEDGNRFVITSRIAGYRNTPLAGPVKHYRVQDMDKDQIKIFLDKWCLALEEAQRPDVSKEEQQAKASKDVAGIMDAVKTSAGVRRLAVNPLLLTILVLIYQSGSKLPQKRIELYQKAVETLARDWQQAKGIDEIELLNDEYLIPLLGKLAYWMHRERDTGLATEEEVLQVLSEEWARINLIDWNSARPNPKVIKEVRSFIQIVREHTGFFLERLPGRFGFMHLTFEEYFAARHLIDQTSDQEQVEMIRKHLHDPRWEEPILLALAFEGLSSSKKATKLLENAVLPKVQLNLELEFDVNYYRDLLGWNFLFGLRCLADQIPIELRVARPLMHRLVDELYLRKTDNARYKTYREALEERVQQLENTTFWSVSISRLVEELEDAESLIREAAAEALGDIEGVEIITALLKALNDSEARVRAAAARALRGMDEPAVITALLKALNDSEARVRAAAVEALMAMDDNVGVLISPKASVAEVRRVATRVLRNRREATIIAILLEALESPEPGIREVAAGALGDRTEPAIVAVLLKALNDSEARVRAAAARALRGIEEVEVITALLRALSDPEAKIRTAAAEALGGKHESEVVVALLKTLKDPQARVRAAAARALGDMDAPTVVTALIKLADDSDPMVRESVVRALHGKEEAEVTTTLLKALNDPQAGVRAAAARALRGTAEPAIVAVLLKALNDSEAKVRESAAWALRSKDDNAGVFISPEASVAEVHLAAARALKRRKEAGVIKILLEALESPEPGIREVAAGALGDRTEPAIVAVLLKALNDSEARVRAAAARALRSREEIEVITALLRALSDPEAEVRTAAADALRDRAGPAVVAVLLKALDDSDPTVRESVVRALSNREEAEVITALLKALNDPQAGVRRAAVEALRNRDDEVDEYISPEASVAEVHLAAARVLRRKEAGVIKTLLEALESPEPGIREVVIEILNNRVEPAIVAVLLKALNDSEARVRATAVRALRGIEEVEVITALLRALSDPEVEVRKVAASALTGVRRHSPEVITTLIRTLNDSNREVRFRVACALASLGLMDNAIIAELLEGLKSSEDWPIRFGCAEALSKIGQGNEKIVDALQQGLLDEDGDVRNACIEALVTLSQDSLQEAGSIARKLQQVLNEPQFDRLDNYTYTPAYDFAFKGLWMLVGGKIEEERDLEPEDIPF